MAPWYKLPDDLSPLENLGSPKMLQLFLEPVGTLVASSVARCVGLRLHPPQRWPYLYAPFF